MTNREIFKYHNGEQDLFADPKAIERKLRISLGGDPATTLKALWAKDDEGKLTASDVEYMIAEEKMIDATRKAFGLQPLDPFKGTGATDELALKLWSEFWDWMDEKKKPPVNSPMLGRFTAPSPTSPSSSASHGRMRPTSASG